MGLGSGTAFAKRTIPLLIIVVLAGIWVFRSPILGAALRYAVVPVLQYRVPGLAVHLGTIETNLFSRARIDQLSIDYCHDGPCLKATIPSLTLSYSFAGLLPWRGLPSLVPHLSLDLDSPSISGNTPSGDSSAPRVLKLPALPILPAIRLNNGFLDLTIPGAGMVSGRGIDLVSPFYLPLGRAPYELTLTAEQMAASGPGVPRQEGAVALTLRYDQGRLEVPELSFAGKTLLKDGLLEETKAQGVRFATELYLLQSRGQVQGSIEQQLAKVSFHLAEGDIEALAGAAGIAPSMSGQVKADGEMTMTLGRPETLAGAVKASIEKGSWGGAVIDHFEIAARAADHKAFVDSMSLVINGSQLTVRELETPIPEAGRQSWLERLAVSRATGQVRLTAIETLPPSWTAPILDHWQALGLTEMSAEVTLDGARLRVARAKVSGSAGQVSLKDGLLDLSAGVSDWWEVPWSVLWQADLSDAAVVHYFWEDWPATGGTVTGKGKFSGTLSNPDLPCNLTFTGASLFGIPLDKVSGQLIWTKDRLALDVAVANRDEDQLTWRGTVDLDQGGLLGTTISTTLGDLAHYLPQDLDRFLQLGGPFAGTAAVAGQFSRLTGDVKASGEWMINGIKLDGANVVISLAADSWGIRNVSGRINDSVAFVATGKLTPRAGWRTVVIGFDTLALSAWGQDLSLQQPGSLTVAADTITVGAPLVLHGDLGSFRLTGALGGRGQLSLTGDGVSDTGLLSQLWRKDLGFERMDFTLGLSGSLYQPQWHWQGTIQELAVDGASLALSGRFDLESSPQGLLIRECALGDDGQSMTLAGRLPLLVTIKGLSLLPQPLNLKGHLMMPEAGVLPRLFPEWLAESGEVQADLTLAGTWDHPQGQIQLDARGVKPGTRLQAAPPGPFTVRGVVAVEDDQLTLSTLDLASPGFSVHTSGSITQIPWAELVDNSQRGEPGSGQITLSGRYSMENLGWLSARIPGVRRVGGSAAGTFAMEGSLSQPEVRADISVKNGEIRGTDSLLVARGISLQASLAHDQLTLATLSGTLGGAEVQGTGTIKGVFSSDPALDMRMTGKDLLLYRADGVKVRAHSSLALEGTVLSPELNGEVLLTDSRITKNVNWLSLLKPGTDTGGSESITLFSFADPPLRDIRFNVRIRGAQPLVISSNVFKGELRPDLTLSGTGELPYLTGVIYADSGLVTLPTGRLEVERGLVRFSEDSPERPALEVQASGRMMGYDITAQVKGAYDEPEVTLSSSPPLANEDLLMLLLTGRPPVTSGAAGGGMSSAAVYFGRGLLSRLLSGEDDEFVLLERLEVDVGRALSLHGEPTVDARFKLADMEWKHDTTFYLTGEKDVWDYYNAGIRVVFRFH